MIQQQKHSRIVCALNGIRWTNAFFWDFPLCVWESRGSRKPHFFFKHGGKWLNKNVAFSLLHANLTGSENHKWTLKRTLPFIWTKYIWYSKRKRLAKDQQILPFKKCSREQVKNEVIHANIPFTGNFFFLITRLYLLHPSCSRALWALSRKFSRVKLSF